MKKPTLSSILTFLIGWPLSLIAVYFIYSKVVMEKDVILENITTINLPALLIGAFCFIAYYYTRSYVWYKLLRYYEVKLSFKESTSLWAVTSLKRYIPGNIWSYIGMAVLLGKKGIEKKHIFQSILFEQQLVVIGCTIIVLLAIPFFATYFIPDYKSLLSLAIPLTLAGTIIYIFNRKVLGVLRGKIASYLEHIFPEMHPGEITKLILLTTFAFFILGAGYFFVILSVTFVNPALFLQIVGLSVFALLIGVLSFITPTGLGVREGVLTVCFSKIMDVGLAGFVSLFARVMLIVAELVFVSIAFLWEKIQHTRLAYLERLTLNNAHLLVVILTAVIYISYFSLAGFLRFDNFYAGRFDLGNMAQTVWNTAHGHIFMFTDPNGTREVTRLAFHADFLLILISPFYFLWENPKMLIFVQAAIVGLGSIFVFLLSHEILKNKTLSVIFALVYLLNPGVQWTLLYDFHAVVLATTFLLGAWYFLIKKKHWPFIIFSILAGISKEQVWLVIALFGLYIAYFQKKHLFGLCLALCSFLIFYFLLWHIIPQASGTAAHFALDYYKDGGDNPGSLITNTLLNPGGTMLKLLEPERMLYLRHLLEPLGYLSLLSPLYLIFAAGDLGINLISDKPHLHQIYYQYSAIITPFLFISAVYGTKTLKKYLPTISYTFIGVYILATTLYGAYNYGPLPGAKKQNIAMFTQPQKNGPVIMDVLQDLPADASVAATNNLGAQLSHRRELFSVPFATESADFVTFLFSQRTYTDTNRDVHTYRDMLKNQSYKIFYQEGYFTVFKRQ